MVKGFAALGGYQCGNEGKEAAMSPDSREIELVGDNSSASRRSLRIYFSFEAILEEVIRARLNGREDEGLLPPRKFWSRPSLQERAKGLSPRAARRMAIRRRVMLELKRGTLVEQPWGAKLMAFVSRIQDAVFTSHVSFTPPRIIRIVKGTDDEGRKTFREVASFDSLADRVILNRMTAYLRDTIEPILSASCYSFRSDGRITHESAIGDLQSWRAAHADRAMYVAECDIRKFFDSIAHETVIRRWREVLGSAGTKGALAMSDEATAFQAVREYLDVYSVPNCPGRGLPQGGSLSVVLANLVLSAADDAVLTDQSADLFYARYCDDVVIAATDHETCAAALERYAKSLDELSLPMHNPENFVYRSTREEDKGDVYFTMKSKRPFLWAAAEKGAPGVAPWVNFLGSQVRFDGATRIRKESIKRHMRALGRVTANAVRESQGCKLKM